MDKTLDRHKRVWKNKPLLQKIYFDWYRMLKADMVKGKTVELGSGSGNFKEFMPEIITSDIDPQPWLDKVFDAHRMPLEAASVSNLVMVDVFHHLADPLRFLKEAYRVLKPGGRLLMLEPYPSPVSLTIYKVAHPEPFDFETDYFDLKRVKAKHPWQSNQAIPYLIFFKNADRFENLFGAKLEVVKMKKLSFLTYPLSGGFEGPQLYPMSLKPLLDEVEKRLQPAADWLAFRCYVVLAKPVHQPKKHS